MFVSYICWFSLTQPPPTYEEVIREKTQEQVLSTSSSASASPLHPVSRVTISTQTDPGSDPDPPEPQGKRFFVFFWGFFWGGVVKLGDVNNISITHQYSHDLNSAAVPDLQSCCPAHTFQLHLCYLRAIYCGEY